MAYVRGDTPFNGGSKHYKIGEWAVLTEPPNQYHTTETGRVIVLCHDLAYPNFVSVSCGAGAFWVSVNDLSEFTPEPQTLSPINQPYVPYKPKPRRRTTAEVQAQASKYRERMAEPGQGKRFVYLLQHDVEPWCKVGISSNLAYRLAQHEAKGWSVVAHWNAHTERAARHIERSIVNDNPSPPNMWPWELQAMMPQGGYTEVVAGDAKKLNATISKMIVKSKPRPKRGFWSNLFGS